MPDISALDREKILLLTRDNAFFGQTRKPWVSMDVELLTREIENRGYKVERRTFSDVVNDPEVVTNQIVFYSFSHKLNVREYIYDTIRLLDNGTNLIVPNKDFLYCHENKGYQEIYKKKLGVKSLNAFYFSSRREIEDREFDFPLVFKTVDGSNATGVKLVHSKEELLQTVKEFEYLPVVEKLDLFRRKYLRKKKSYTEYPNYSNRRDYYQYSDYILREKRFILQQFVPNLGFDIRVLVMYDRYYIMKRNVKKGDFRASGAKLFDMKYEPDRELLEWSRSLYNKFDTPYFSIDVGQADGEYYLFEYQALHMGMNPIVKYKGFYMDGPQGWHYVEHKPVIEEAFAHGLTRYLDDRLGNKS